MSLSIFPARVPIGRVQTPSGALDVLMTPEFSRALSDLLTKANNTDNESGIVDANVLAAFTIDVAPMPSANNIDALAYDSSDGAQVSALREEVAALRAELASVAVYSGLVQQVEDLARAVALINEPRPIVKGIATGSRGANVALLSLLSALAGSGLVTDSTVP